MKNSTKWFTGCRRMAAQTVMNMLAGMALCMLVLAGCSKDTPVEDPDKPEQPEAPVEVTLTLSASDLVFDAKGGWKEFTIQCPTAWTITGGNAWCQPGATSGSGKSQVKVMVEASMLTEDRNVNLTVKAGTLKAVLAVTQKGVDALTLSKDKFEVEQQGGDITVEVKSNIGYTVTIPTAFSRWLKQSPQTKAMTTKNYRFTVSPNEGTEKREGYIVFAGNALKDTVRVFQARKEEEKSLILGKESCFLSAAAQELSVELKTNIDYEVVVPDSVGGWISHLETKTIRTDRLYFSIGENKGNRTRVATIVIKERDGELSDTLQVSQMAQYIGDKAIFITYGKQNYVSAMTMGFTRRLKCGIDYEFHIPDTCAWIYPPTFYPNGDLNVQFSQNETSFTRHGIIIVQDKNSALTDTLYITQGIRGALLLDGTVYNAPATTICRWVNVRSDIDCEVIIPEEFSGWLSLHKIEEGHIEIYIRENRSYETRHGEVSVRDRKSGQTETLHIYQDAWNDAMIWGGKEVYVFDGRFFSFKLNPAYEYDFIIPENSHWIELNQVINNESVSFNVITRNLTPETRHASILVREKNDGLTDTVHVHQASQIWMNQTTIHAKAQGLDTILYTKDYYPAGHFAYRKLLVPDESSSWIKWEDYYESCRILISANAGDQERSAEIYVDYSNEKWYDTLHIRQAAAGQELPYLRLSQSKADVKGEGGSVSVTVSTNVEYEVVIPTEAKGWLSWTMTESNDELRLAVTTNEGTEERCTEIILRGKNSDVTATLRVCQAGKEAMHYLKLDREYDNMWVEGGTILVRVKTDVEYEVVIPAEEKWWISLEESNDKALVVLNVTANGSTEERCASITFKGTNTDVTAMLQVCQSGREKNIADKFDPKFAKMLQEKKYIKNATDITEKEVSGITSLNLTNGYVSDDVKLTSMQGIEYFTALTSLECSDNLLATLDVSGCKALTNLVCSNNSTLTSLDLNGCTALTSLDCSSNKLTSLDVSECVALTTLLCNNNELTSLDVSQNMKLTMLRCWVNQLISLNVNGCRELSTLQCSNNKLTNLDASGCAKLTRLECNENQLTSLDLNGCTALESLRCSENQLTSFDVSGCRALTLLYCGNNQLTSLEVSQNTALTDLSCNNNIQITSLDLSKNIALKKLDFSSNRLDANLNVVYCKLSSLNVSGCKALTTLNCYYTNLTSLDVSGCTALTTLRCYRNQLTSLKMEGCTALTTLDCCQNQFISLDVSGCTALRILKCYQNQLTSLNVSGCTALTTLDCYQNQFISLDVSGCTALRTLKCYQNQLTSLNVSGCTALTTLDCYQNQLTSLDVNDVTTKLTLQCHENPGKGEYFDVYCNRDGKLNIQIGAWHWNSQTINVYIRYK